MTTLCKPHTLQFLDSLAASYGARSESLLPGPGSKACPKSNLREKMACMIPKLVLGLHDTWKKCTELRILAYVLQLVTSKIEPK